jgi:hypothetical protein
MTTRTVPLSPAIGGGVTRPHPSVLAQLPHWVYRVYDEADELLYVGCTYLTPEARIRVHRSNNPRLSSRLHHWRAQLYQTMAEALAVEGMWIDLVDPPLNGMRSGVAARRQVTNPKPIGEDSGLLRGSA